MTREELERAAKDWWINAEPGYVTAADFALEMVRKHNEELQKIAAKYLDTGELIDEMKKAKP